MRANWLFCLLFSFPLWAKTPDIQIQSDTLDINNKTQIAHFIGHVKLSHPRMHIQGDQITVRYTQQHITQIHCTGEPAHFQLYPIKTGQDSSTGTAQHIDYTVPTALLTLEGQVHIQHAHQMINAQRMLYDVRKETLRILGSTGKTPQQVQVILPATIRSS